MQTEALVYKFAATLAEMEAKTIGGTLSDVESEALVDTTPNTLPEVRVRIMPIY